MAISTTRRRTIRCTRSPCRRNVHHHLSAGSGRSHDLALPHVPRSGPGRGECSAVVLPGAPLDGRFVLRLPRAPATRDGPAAALYVLAVLRHRRGDRPRRVVLARHGHGGVRQGTGATEQSSSTSAAQRRGVRKSEAEFEPTTAELETLRRMVAAEQDLVRWARTRP